MTTDDIMVLCDQVRDTAYAVHVYHGFETKKFVL